jgi:hypothetical protein
MILNLMVYIQNRYLEEEEEEEEEEDQISLKHPYLPNKRYGVISRKTLTVTTHSLNFASMCRWMNELMI